MLVRHGNGHVIFLSTPFSKISVIFRNLIACHERVPVFSVFRCVFKTITFQKYLRMRTYVFVYVSVRYNSLLLSYIEYWWSYI